MSQININVTQDFEEALARFMRLRGLATKSEAVRLAVRECLERELVDRQVVDFFAWIGLGSRLPENPSPRFSSDDDLWR